VVGTSTKKSTKEDKEKIKEIMGDDAHMIDDMTPRQMYAMLRDAKADIMLSGGRSQFVALKARMPWMDINQERHHAFAGYEGMVTMVAEIDKALFNPVWAQVRSAGTLGERPAAGRRLPDMAHVTESKKACAVNPLKMSQPLGASYAFMGLGSCMPLMHGSQGCTSFGVVLLVRHFKEAIPLQTSAMNEATTIMGGYDNLEQALLNIRSRAKPALIGICSTGLTETKGDDVDGYIRLARQKHPELADTEIVYVSTPDYVGAFQDGWAKAVTALVSQLPLADSRKRARRQRAAGLPPDAGRHRRAARHHRSFGLQPTFVPDVSGSLDGHIPEQWLGTTLGGTPLSRAAALGGAAHTLAIGEQMRPAAAGAAGALRCALHAVRPAHRPDRHRRLGPDLASCRASRCRHGCAASAASWWTPCSTATSTSATSRWRWPPSPTCCGPPATCSPKWAPNSPWP
jgi:nitrogenase molybdenum-iron protein alpha/beta subunit